MLNNLQKQALLASIRTVEDFPKPGVNYKDITTLLARPDRLLMLCDHLADYYREKQIDAIASIESRGFIFGAILAYKLGVCFVPIRKAGKLPYDTVSETYQLEYGSDTLEIHKDAFAGLKKPNVLLLDDVLATGGTSQAALTLIEKVGGLPAMACFILTLNHLPGKALLEPQLPVYSVLVE